MNHQAEKKKRTLVAQVVSNKMDKTVKVSIKRTVMHRRYRKHLSRRTFLLVHDPKNQCQEGDTIVIEETRPISRLKAWKLVEKISSNSAL